MPLCTPHGRLGPGPPRPQASSADPHSSPPPATIPGPPPAFPGVGGGGRVYPAAILFPWPPRRIQPARAPAGTRPGLRDARPSRTLTHRRPTQCAAPPSVPPGKGRGGGGAGSEGGAGRLAGAPRDSSPGRAVLALRGSQRACAARSRRWGGEAGDRRGWAWGWFRRHSLSEARSHPGCAPRYFWLPRFRCRIRPSPSPGFITSQSAD